MIYDKEVTSFFSFILIDVCVFYSSFYESYFVVLWCQFAFLGCYPNSYNNFFKQKVSTMDMCNKWPHISFIYDIVSLLKKGDKILRDYYIVF